MHAFTDSKKCWYAHLIFPPYQLSLIQDTYCNSCLVCIYADVALKEGKQSIRMAPTVLYYWTVFYSDVQVSILSKLPTGCLQAIVLQLQFILQLWIQTLMKAKWPSPRIFTLLQMKLERIWHMLLVKKTNMNFRKMLFLNATIFVDNYWKIDWYKSWKK